MIAHVLFMCLTNPVSTSASNMNKASSSSPNINNNNSNNEEKKEDILDVIFDYTGNGDDELTLRRGSKLEVLSKDESISGSQGWWTGRLVDSESVGIFPANFVSNSQSDLRIIDYNDLHIGGIIGIGGFGHVYHGKFGDIDVAIKTAKSLVSFSSIQTPTSPVNDDSSDTVLKTLIDSLLREARLFSNLKHQNIIQLYGVSPCLTTKNLYLVMEYAHGGALSYLLQRRQTGLYPNVLREYAKQIANGMKYLHEEACEHIIHRDLKCSNILILEHVYDVHDDNDLMKKTLKITDFGLAKKQIQSSSMSAAGTFAWMSPECIRNSEYSTKSDVWSFGVLLWECLTGELPYKGFDQMQVAFGIATNKYSLPIPSTCPEEFSRLMTSCWHPSPQDRPTFNDLLDQIDQNPVASTEESYQSLQNDWRQEIQEMFNELKEKEQEIRDREQAMYERSLEQNLQRLELEKWEQQLYEREMHIVELELRLLMATNNQERVQNPTPKIQKRSGRFMRSLLNGTHSHSPQSSNKLISSPTNFRHLISVCHNHPGLIDHQNSSPSIPTSSSSPMSCPISLDSSQRISSPRSYSSNSTPATPNINRLRTLTSRGDFILNKRHFDEYLPLPAVHFPNDGCHSMTPPDKPPRSMSQSKACGRKSRSSFMRRKSSKNGESKWYLEAGNANKNNNNQPDSSAISTPNIDRPSRKSGSSSSSLCSTPNDRSIFRAFFDISSLLTSIGLGRRVKSPLNLTPQHQPVLLRSRLCSSPVRPNSLLLSSLSQNSSQITDDDNERYYSAQSSKISTPMVQNLDYRKHSHEKLVLSSMEDTDHDQQKHLPSELDKTYRKDFLR